MAFSNGFLKRRQFLTGAGALASVSVLGACSSTSNSSQGFGVDQALGVEPAPFDNASIYAARFDSDIDLPAFDYTKMNAKYLRQWVRYSRRHAPGTIVVDNEGPYLYLVQSGRRAIRYGIAVGREGYAWHGKAVMKWKQPWPTWTPPKEMIERSPKLAVYEDGMPPGVENPLGARALYLYKDGKDTLFRIHGTNRPYSIGKNASSGCFRMINHDVIDLYNRVNPGAPVVVLADDISTDIDNMA